MGRSTGLVLPVADIVRALSERGIDTLVDGAHAPGMLDLDLDRLGAAYYTGNCHKWLCAPKGAALLWVRRDRQHLVRPTSISHGANSPRTDRARFQVEGDWLGTFDPTAWLCVPTALEFLGSLFAGGWAELRARNRELVLEGRRSLCETLDIGAPAPESMIGSLAAVPLPDGDPGEFKTPLHLDPIHVALFEEHRIEVPVMAWPAPPRRVLRISAQAYNRAEQYERLATALSELV